ncbi:MAG TPA: response regulator [Candidatus Dormibacteraeota bacterium]|nr:response regulator [Candidatus Dormibacteraeota bacterium]
MIKSGVVDGTLIQLSWQAGRVWLPDLVGMPSESWSERNAVVAAKRPSSAEPTRVLLIEDDTTIAEMYRLQLEYDGYHVTVVNTGEGALRALQAARPDIILLDLLLPDRSGLEVMVDIKQAFSDHPPVVILSNYGEPTMIERGLSLGAVEYMVKSRVTPDSVSRSIPGWLELGSEHPPQHH